MEWVSMKHIVQYVNAYLQIKFIKFSEFTTQRRRHQSRIKEINVTKITQLGVKNTTSERAEKRKRKNRTKFMEICMLTSCD